MSLAMEQQDAVIKLYHLLTDGNMIFTNDDSDIKAMARFCDLFDWCASSPMELDEVNRRWIPTFDAAKHVVELMEQDRISVVEIWGGRNNAH